MDWNWFFSSVAQSVAALDGTLLAFVIAKLLNNQADYSRKLSRARELVRHAHGLRDAASIRYFSWYNDRVLGEAIDEVIRRVRRLYEPLEDVLRGITLPEYLDEDVAARAIKDALEKEEREEQERESAELDRRRREANVPGLGLLGMNQTLMANLAQMPSAAEMQNRVLRNAALEKEIADERESLRRLRVDVSDSIRNIKAFEAELGDDPESSTLIRAILVGGLALFLLGVIYPLSFLPLPPHWDRALSMVAFIEILLSIRGVILTLAVVVFGGVILVLWITNARLRYPKNVLADLRIWSLEGSYSQYLEVRTRNAQKKAAAIPEAVRSATDI